ncbi:magnesium transporter [Leucobacter exalbidus]|uniref:Magnesium transporter n=1 Tax=Leucobacter exalbidus TaxID=662960 RepID=A0A940PP49_9MICO|nr:magnesium and cobalt transport protein CorA [Leucobacter exalbidus]MBP1326620.1 magnesium transporter [Leucobacter exalbidus]
MSLVDIAVYLDGVRVPGAGTLPEAAAQARELGGFVWLGLLNPSDAEVQQLGEVFGLHPLALEDVSQGHQRPKLERYDDSTFLVLRPARYLPDTELVEFGELHVFIGPNFIVSIRLAEHPKLSGMRQDLEQQPEVLRLGPPAVLHALLDRVVDDYEPVVRGIEKAVDEIEDELFDGSGSRRQLARRIYLLSREVITFQRAARPLLEAIKDPHQVEAAGLTQVELRRYLRDVVDHLIPICDRIDNYRQLLQNALTVHLSLATQAREEEMAQMTQTSIEQSEAMKKISSWAAIIFAPTLISGIYGMNFATMPELDWGIGYPLAMLAMGGFAVTLYVIFKRKNWL